MNARQRLLQLVNARQPPTDLAKLSRAVGRNHAYLQQYVKRGVPRRLPEEVRYQLAELLNVHHRELLDEDDILPALPANAPGLNESPGIPFRHAPKTLLQSGTHPQILHKQDTYYLAGVKADSEHSYALEVKDNSLNLSGFMIGDVVISALDAPCEGARFVIAQLYDDNDRAETLIRAWQPPYLMPHSTDPGFRPIDTNEVDVRIVSPILKKISLFQ